MVEKGKPKVRNPFVVYHVEDDDLLREYIKNLLLTVGLKAINFSDADDFLDFYSTNVKDMRGCILLDVRMPGLSGMDLYRKLKEQNCSLEVLFVTGNADIPIAVEAVQMGAHAFLTKPFRDNELLEKISQLEQNYTLNSSRVEEKINFDTKLNLLTKREQEVFDRLIEGVTNKKIAFELNISSRTVEVHRSNIFKKLDTKSMAVIAKNFATSNSR